MEYAIIRTRNTRKRVIHSAFYQLTVNLLLPSVPYMTRLAKLLILIQEGMIKKISYEHSDYESVDEKSLSYPM